MHFWLYQSACDGGWIDFGTSSDTNLGRIRYWRALGDMAFSANNAERMRISGSGNVGIGTSDPDEKLHIYSGNLKLTHTNTIYWSRFSASHHWDTWKNTNDV